MPTPHQHAYFAQFDWLEKFDKIHETESRNNFPSAGSWNMQQWRKKKMKKKKKKMMTKLELKGMN